MKRIASVVFSGVLLFSLAGLVGKASADTAKNPSSTTGKTATEVVKHTLAGETLHRTTLAHLDHADQWQALSNRIETLTAEYDTFKQKNIGKPALIGSIELDRYLTGIHREVTKVTDRLSLIVESLERDDLSLESNAKSWEEHAEFLEKQSVPKEVLERAQSLKTKLEQASVRVREFRNKTLIALERGVTLQAEIEDARVQIAMRQIQLDAQRAKLAESPIWQLGSASAQFNLIGAELSSTWQLQRDYLAQDGAGLAGLFVFVLVFSFWLFTRRRNGPVEPSERAYGRPFVASLVLALVFIGWLAPNPPRLFIETLVLLLPIPAAMIAVRATAVPIPLTLYGIALSTMILAARTQFDASPIAFRLLMLLQVICVAVPITIDLRNGRLQRAFTWPGPKVIRALSILTLVGAAVSTLSVVFGFVGPIGALRSGVGSLLGSVLVFGAAAAVLDGLARALLATPVAQWFHSARDADPALLRAIRLLIRTFAVISVLAVSLGTLDLNLAVNSMIDTVMDTVWQIGTVTIAVKSLFLALVVAFATAVLTGITGFILDREVVPRLTVSAGAGYAIGTFTRWSMLIIGAALTMAALGIDTSNITLLAGALSVGIGFGLQNVINNFVSGLILIVERPIGVGDVIEWGKESGTITHIGIRSSTVRTEQGSEILVPNGDLVSKDVVNWTRSDRRRRYDIDVDVAFGSAPERVMQLLAEAAAEVPEVLKKPPPQVVFKSFGESSLNFTVNVWVETVEEELTAQNALRVAMLKKLETAGIAPFNGGPHEGHASAHPAIAAS